MVIYHNLYRVAGAPVATTAPDSPALAAISEITIDHTFAASPATCHIYELPNELILHILTLLPTAVVLPVAAVSQRLHALTIRLLYARLNQATSLSHDLILECYPPSQKLSAPALDCVYSGSPGIEACLDTATPCGQLEALKQLYCHFRPQRREWRRLSRAIPGDIPGSRTHPTSTAEARARWQAEREQDTVKQLLSLEGHELFVQLEGNLHLVRNSGFIRNLVPVHEGYVRIWRDWLGQRAEADAVAELSRGTVMDLQQAGPSARAACEAQGQVADQEPHEHERVLWLDATRSKYSPIFMKLIVLRSDFAPSTEHSCTR